MYHNMFSKPFSLLCFCLLLVCVQGLEDTEERLVKVEVNVNELSTEVQSLATEVKTLSKSVANLMQFVKTIIHKQDELPLHYDSTLNKRILDTLDDDLETSVGAMNDSNIEERVTALEFQMENVHEDITVINNNIETLNAGLADLEQDIEAQIDNIQIDQEAQDERLLEVEGDVELVQTIVETLEETVVGLESSLNASVTELDLRVEGLNSTIDDLLESVKCLEETDLELTTAIDELMAAIEDVNDLTENLDSRLFKLELNGTVAFHAVLVEYTSIPDQTAVKFNEVNVNIGNAYDGITGEFTVPPGGDGLYYFYAHMNTESGEYGIFDMMHNDKIICVVLEDEQNGGDSPASSCGAVTNAREGDVVYLRYSWGIDDTPVVSTIWPHNSFTGFRVAPQ